MVYPVMKGDFKMTKTKGNVVSAELAVAVLTVTMMIERNGCDVFSRRQVIREGGLEVSPSSVYRALRELSDAGVLIEDSPAHMRLPSPREVYSTYRFAREDTFETRLMYLMAYRCGMAGYTWR